MARLRIRSLIKTLATYLLLVAPPLAGLVALLHLGAGLAAPHAIGGDWDVAPGDPACAVRAGDDGHVVLRVSQSGPRADATLTGASRTTLSLELEGDRIVGSGTAPGGPCNRISIEARFAEGALAGVMRHPGCGRCGDVAFRATRKLAR